MELQGQHRQNTQAKESMRKHVKNVEDVLKTGDKIKVKLINIDEMKRLKLSIKALLDKPDDYKEPERKPFNKNKKDFKKFSKRKA